ncbi:MAG: DinB family protein [Acidobacteria bacterium]|nr:DinB family protein [Acidobacteriota bacterium]
MKIRSLFLILLLSCVALIGCRSSSSTMDASTSSTFSPRERAELDAYLDQTRDMFLRSVQGLTEEQIHWKPSSERWSIAQVAEHIAASESMIRGAIEGALAAPASADMLVDAQKETMIRQMVTDRSQTFNAPEPLQPTNRYGNFSDTIDVFRTERMKTERLAHDGGNLRLYAAEHPAGGPVDAVGWFYFLSGHTERHTKQIEELKARPDFPRGS